MTRESDIVHQSGAFWVLRDRAAYVVMRDLATHAVSDCGFPKTDDGLSLAVARCDYLAGRAVRAAPRNHAEERPACAALSTA